MVTTIQVENDVKKKLDSLKVHPRESYNDLIERMIKGNYEGKENLVETIEILSDPSLMKGIAEGVEDFKKRRWISLEELDN